MRPLDAGLVYSFRPAFIVTLIRAGLAGATARLVNAREANMARWVLLLYGVENVDGSDALPHGFTTETVLAETDVNQDSWRVSTRSTVTLSQGYTCSNTPAIRQLSCSA